MGFMDIFKISVIKQENEQLKKQLNDLQKKADELGVTEYYQTQEKINALYRESEKKLKEAEDSVTAAKRNLEAQTEAANKTISEHNETISKLKSEINTLNQTADKLDRQQKTQTNKLARSKELYKSVEYAIGNFFESDVAYENCKLSQRDFEDYELISPSITLKLHCMDVKDLRKAYRDNEKQIDKVLSQYSARYTTKANKSIYNLMVIALRAELQNIMYNLKYEKLDKSIEDVKNVSAKYLKIAGDGNQSIAGTLTKFIGEIEYLFINAVKIEYNYYVKKEQAKQEQLALREQMRQEAEERKALEAEKKKIEREEAKFNIEIAKLQENLNSAVSDEEIAKLKSRILELQGQLSDVALKKEEISNLQNGKAGNVYIISNLGSFGEDVFKIGMTRRLDPQDRINELGSASVPFKFDVHSFIFSNDAVALESTLHNRLTDKRLNKVNMRKEFFKVSMSELENLVMEIDPTAEFNQTMLAEEYRQSLSSDEVYTSNYVLEDYDEDDE